MARAALAQGVFSFPSSTFSVLLLEYLYGLGKTAAAGSRWPRSARRPSSSWRSRAATSWRARPAWSRPLLPSWISGAIFSVVYTLNLRRLERAGAAPASPAA